MRSFLTHADLNVTSIKDEIELNRNYLDLEQLRFKDKMDYTIEVAPDIDQQNTMIPTVMIQPFLENAIRHGIFHKEEGIGKILLSIHQDEESIHIKIRDNGVGLQASKKINAASRINHESKGLKLLERKRELLHVLEDLKVEMTIHEIIKEDKIEGTEVILVVHKEMAA